MKCHRQVLLHEDFPAGADIQRKPRCTPRTRAIAITSIAAIAPAAVGVIVSTVRAIDRSKTSDDVAKVIMPVRRMINRILATARSATLQSTELRNQPRIVEQIDAARVQQRQQINVQLRLRLGRLLIVSIGAQI